MLQFPLYPPQPNRLTATAKLKISFFIFAQRELNKKLFKINPYNNLISRYYLKFKSILLQILSTINNPIPNPPSSSFSLKNLVFILEIFLISPSFLYPFGFR
jgi:hypothetical protein